MGDKLDELYKLGFIESLDGLIESETDKINFHRELIRKKSQLTDKAWKKYLNKQQEKANEE